MMIKRNIKKFVILVSSLVTLQAYADVHKFKGADGSALLSNRTPVVSSAINKSDATISDLKPHNYEQTNNANGTEYIYQGTSKAVTTNEKVHIGAQDRYKAGYCKMGNVIVLCYQYDKTLPATTVVLPNTKLVNVDSQKVIKEALEQSN